jgi:hypothetical protein
MKVKRTHVETKEKHMYLKDYDIIKLQDGFRLVNQNDPEDKHDPIDQGLFKPGDHFEVGYNGYLSFKGNLYDDIMKQNITQGEEIES